MSLGILVAKWEFRAEGLLYKVQHQILTVNVWNSVSQDMVGLGWS